MQENNYSSVTKQRFMNVVAIIMSVTGLLSFYLFDSKLFYDVLPATTSVFAPTVLVLTGVFIFLLNYLKSGSATGSSDEAQILKEELKIVRREFEENLHAEYKFEYLESELLSLKAKLDNLNFDKALVDEVERKEIIKRVEESVKKEASHSILKEIEERFSADLKKERYLKDLRKQFSVTRSRLNDEINSLGRRGNVNLAIGVITTIAAVIILSSTVLGGDVTLNRDELLSYYMPRFTLSVFIEVFSFFFLKLYKTGLSEIKYFQNELTNAEMKFIAAEKAILLDNEASIKTVIDNLCSTERNFKLSKGESTIDLEKERADKESLSSVLSAVTQILNAKK